MNVKSKYLKDETGEVISPVVSTQTVYDASGNTLGGGIVPIGTVLPYVGKTAPLNYLLCDGSVYNKSDYPDLYNLMLANSSIGITNTTFYVPDLKGRFVLGYNSGIYNIGVTGGEKTHKLTVNEMPSHIHSLGWSTSGRFIKMTHENDSDTNSYGFDFHKGFAGDVDSNGYNLTRALPTGGSQSHNNMPPYIVLNYIIRAK